MERTEFRAYFKEKLKAMGYQSRKSYNYKIFDDDYLIGFELDPSSYCKGYQLRVGIIYLPDENKMPLRGLFDLEWSFIFPWEPDDDPDISKSIERKLYRRTFHYEKYTFQQFDKIWEANYKYFVEPLLDKNYGLEIIRSEWRHMNRFSVQSVEKLCKRAGLDTHEVLTFLGKA